MLRNPFATPTLLLASTLVSLVLTAPAQAQGLTGLHSKVHVGNKLCFTSHEHTGYARIRGSKRTSVQAAVRNWNSFTKIEYGSSWASFQKAEGRKFSCRASRGAWSCKVTARPCR